MGSNRKEHNGDTSEESLANQTRRPQKTSHHSYSCYPCSLSQADEQGDWSAAHSIHVRTTPLVRLVELFRPLFLE